MTQRPISFTSDTRRDISARSFGTASSCTERDSGIRAGRPISGTHARGLGDSAGTTSTGDGAITGARGIRRDGIGTAGEIETETSRAGLTA